MDEVGNIGYENWRAFLAAEPWTEGHEVALYSDVALRRDITDDFGPYQLLNIDSGGEGVRRSLILSPCSVRIIDDWQPS